MKKIIAVLSFLASICFIIAIVSIFMIACSEQELEQGRKSSLFDRLTYGYYVKDNRTDVCYFVECPNCNGNVFTQVPCTDLVEKNIKFRYP